MAIDLSIPVYRGGYNMEADAWQSEMVEIRDLLLDAVLSEGERKAIQTALTERYLAAGRGYPSVSDAIEAQIARVRELLPARIGNKDRHGWTVDELIARFEELRAKLAREYGLVRF